MPDKAMVTYTRLVPGRARAVRRHPRQCERGRGNDDVDRDGDESRGGEVVHAKQVESGEQAAEHGARRVPSVEETEPRDAARCRLDPSRDRGERRSHHQCRRQQHHRAHDAAQQQPGKPQPHHGGVDVADDRHDGQHEQSEHTDPEFQHRVHAQRMLPPGNHVGEQETADAHPTHERPEKDTKRDGRRTYDQLEQLEPDDLVDERRAAAADEQQEQEWKETG
jgi:hypothetical protein